MLNTIQSLEKRYQEINQQLTETHDDYQEIADLAKERSDLEPVVNKGREYIDKLNA